MGKRKRVELNQPRMAPPVWRRRGRALLLAPYVYTFATFAKQRWFGRPVLEVLEDEFGRGKAPDYFERALSSGLIRINGEKVAPERPFQEHDRLSHMMHRHEPPVSAERIRVCGVQGSLACVSKPAPLPVHACGGYHMNSLKVMLEQRLNTKIHLCHRLDRLTTGLVVFAMDSKRAAEVAKQIRGRECDKRYLARVRGDFPSAEAASRAEEVVRDGETWLQVSAPLRCQSPKDGIWEVAVAGAKDAKDATTLLRKLSGNGESTVVEVRPLTGRTHQIRLHCQHLGHPIANDPCYGGSTSFGLPDGRKAPSEDLTAPQHDTVRIEDLVDVGDYPFPSLENDGGEPQVKPQVEPQVEPQGKPQVEPQGEPQVEQQVERKDGEEKQASPIARGDPRSKRGLQGVGADGLSNDLERAAIELWQACQETKATGSDAHSAETSSSPDLDPEDAPFGTDHRGVRSGGIWLHAWKYSCEDWAFEVPRPDWAT